MKAFVLFSSYMTVALEPQSISPVNTEERKTLGLRSGDTVRVHQKIQEKGKTRIQVFEGLVIAKKHGKGISATITVRKIIGGIGVEKIYPLHSPTLEKIEILKRSKVRRAKLYYLRRVKGGRARLKQKELAEIIPEGTVPREIPEEKTENKTGG